MKAIAVDAGAGGIRRVLPRAAALAALAWLAWRVLALGLADHFSLVDPDVALAWRDDHPEALLAAAREARRSADEARAAALARSALRAYPLPGGGYRVLAELAGSAAEAEPFYATAARRAPRDIPSLAWLADRALLRGDYTGALALVDRILRVEPELLPRIFPALATIAGVAEARPALAELLRSSPPWRGNFLLSLARKAEDLAAVNGVVVLLRQGGLGLAQPELDAWIERLIAEKRWGAAYQTWANQLPGETRRSIGNVFNGGFELHPSNSGFDWRFRHIPGARVDLAAIEGMAGQQALRVAFEPRRVPFRHVRQLMALPAGDYRLEGRALLDGLQTERGLVWVVTCADGNKELAQSEAFSGNRAWRSFAFGFAVPAAGCGGQWLELRLPARIPAEQRIAGTAWFDDLRVLRTAAIR